MPELLEHTVGGAVVLHTGGTRDSLLPLAELFSDPEQPTEGVLAQTAEAAAVRSTCSAGRITEERNSDRPCPDELPDPLNTFVLIHVANELPWTTGALRRYGIKGIFEERILRWNYELESARVDVGKGMARGVAIKIQILTD